MSAPDTKRAPASVHDTPKHMGVVGFLRAVVPYFAPHKPTALLIVVTMLVDLAYATIVPLLFQALIDHAIVPHDMRMLFIILIALAAGAGIATVSGFVQDLAYARAGVAVMNAMRLRLFSHLQQLSADFHTRTQVGDIVSRFSSDLASVENALIWYLPSILQAAGAFVLSVALLFRLEWRLALLSVVGLLVSFWFAKRLEPTANELTYALKEEIGVVAVAVEENLQAQSVVRGFNLQRARRERFGSKLADDQTVISVTHRLAPVVHCDRIFVLDGGKLVEEGTHEDLLARCGVYASLRDEARSLLEPRHAHPGPEAASRRGDRGASSRERCGGSRRGWPVMAGTQLGPPKTKSRTTGMCCIPVAAESVTSTGATSISGVYTRLSKTSPAPKLTAPIVTGVFFASRLDPAKTKSCG